MNFRTKACIVFLAAALAGCNMTETPDPTLSGKDKEFLSLAPQATFRGEYRRFIVDDPTGAAAGHDHHRYDFKNFLYFSLPNKKAVRYGVATGNEAAGWHGEADGRQHGRMAALDAAGRHARALAPPEADGRRRRPAGRPR